MATNPMSEVIQQLRRAALANDGAGLTDGQLLEGFVSRREAAALGALVQRHGPMVWGVCRRLLPSHHDAEDAFQATFLVLVRKAGSIRPREMVGNWLYGVAHQTARKARATAAKRKQRERQVRDLPEPTSSPPETWPDLKPLLDEELSRLPAKYRVAIVLCDLEGKSRQDAARQLQLPEGTVASRLARARALLAKRLAGRGVVLCGGALVAMFSPYATSACVPTAVMSSTIKAATLIGAGQAAANGLISAPVASLTEGVLKVMFLNQLKVVTAVLLLLGTAGIGGGLLVHHAAVGQQPEAKRVAAPAAKDGAERQGDPERVARGAGGKAVPSPEKPVPESATKDAEGTVGPPQPGEPAWKAEFRKVYGLADGQALKLIPGDPFPDCRRENGIGPRLDANTVVRFASDGQRLAIRHIKIGAYGRRQEQTANGVGERVRGVPLRELLEGVFQIAPPLLEADEEVRQAEVYADVVVRKGAPRDRVARDLAKELGEKCRLAVILQPREEEREVVLAQGKYVHKPRPGRLNGVVDIAARALPADDEAATTYADAGGGRVVLLRRLGEYIGRPVLDETDPASWKFALVDGKDPASGMGYLGCRWPRRGRFDGWPADGTADRDAVLQHVTDQTGVRFQTAKRKVWVLSVKRTEK